MNIRYLIVSRALFSALIRVSFALVGAVPLDILTTLQLFEIHNSIPANNELTAILLLFCFDEEMVKEVFDSFDKNNIQLEHNISVQDVLDSYLVVGAVDKKKKNGTWQLANFSNYGKTITVCAPGVDVFSTTVMGGLNGNYANDSGTSMAAPIVAGITAMVWSTNLDMSSGTVKNIIQQTADIAVSSRRKADNGSYYMINAAKAVEFALDYTPINLEDKQTDIPSEAVKFNGHSYYVYNLSSVTTWEEAKEYCESKISVFISEFIF